MSILIAVYEVIVMIVSMYTILNNSLSRLLWKQLNIILILFLNQLLRMKITVLKKSAKL